VRNVCVLMFTPYIQLEVGSDLLCGY
jgi:hypothetical protein